MSCVERKRELGLSFDLHSYSQYSDSIGCLFLSIALEAVVGLARTEEMGAKP